MPTEEAKAKAHKAVQAWRRALPTHCRERSTAHSMLALVGDTVLVARLVEEFEPL